MIKYTRFVEGVLVDRTITDVEREFLGRKALQLGIDAWVSRQIEQTLLAIATQ